MKGAAKMAKLSLSGLDEFQDKLMQRQKAATEAVPEMLKAGAAVLVKAQQEEVKRTFTGKRSTGDLAASIKSTAVKEKQTEKFVEVYPHGKDRHGVSNATKGFVLQYGRSNMPARPWMTAANEKAADEVQGAMRNAWEGKQND